jgi:effector-binding domain-containing protein
MAETDFGIVHKALKETLALTIRLTIREREELHSVFEKIGRESEGSITGPPFAVFYWDTGVEGVEVEAGFPVSEPLDTAIATSRVLEGAEAFTAVHVGSYEGLQQTYGRLYTQLYARGIPASLVTREIFQKHNIKNPRQNLTEVQVLIHNWGDRLALAVGELLGADARKQVMMGSELLSPETGKEERASWLCRAVERLDKLADDDQKYEILSKCAHVFPEQRIQKLRRLFLETGEIGSVLKEMAEDPDWYETPVMEASGIRVKKVPYNRKAFDEATSSEEKRKAYCHCPMVKEFFDKTPSSFCYCGSGWYRRLWEGITGNQVRVRIVKTLVKGDDYCEFIIEIPHDRLSRKKKD